MCVRVRSYNEGTLEYTKSIQRAPSKKPQKKRALNLLTPILNLTKQNPSDT